MLLLSRVMVLLARGRGKLVMLADVAFSPVFVIADTMIPEALEQGGPYVALWTALGLLVAFFVKTMGG